MDDLGSDVPVDRFLARAKENGADIIAASALLTTTMPVQKAIADGIPSLGLAPRPRLLVGGAPTTAAWAAQIGAAWAENALRAVAVAEVAGGRLPARLIIVETGRPA